MVALLNCVAAAIGAYLTAAGIGMLWKKDTYLKIAEEITKSPTLVWLSSWLAYGTGIAILYATQNSWQGWVGLLTLMGWIALLKGIVRAIDPTLTEKLVKKMDLRTYMSWVGIVIVLVGLFLLGKGMAWF